MKKAIVGMGLAMALAGCQTTYQGQRAATGALVGAGAGALVGGVATGTAGGALAGAAIGGAGGAIIGAATAPSHASGRWCRGYDGYGRRTSYRC